MDFAICRRLVLPLAFVQAKPCDKCVCVCVCARASAWPAARAHPDPGSSTFFILMIPLRTSSECFNFAAAVPGTCMLHRLGQPLPRPCRYRIEPLLNPAYTNMSPRQVQRR